MSSLKEKTGVTLLSTTTVALNATGATTLYTVPPGKRCVITKAVMVFGADAAVGSNTTLTIGKSTALTDFLNTQTLVVATFGAAYDAAIFQQIPAASTALAKSYAAGDIIQINVTAGNGGASNTLYLFGFLY